MLFRNSLEKWPVNCLRSGVLGKSPEASAAVWALMSEAILRRETLDRSKIAELSKGEFGRSWSGFPQNTISGMGTNLVPISEVAVSDKSPMHEICTPQDMVRAEGHAHNILWRTSSAPGWFLLKPPLWGGHYLKACFNSSDNTAISKGFSIKPMAPLSSNPSTLSSLL